MCLQLIDILNIRGEYMSYYIYLLNFFHMYFFLFHLSKIPFSIQIVLLVKSSQLPTVSHRNPESLLRGGSVSKRGCQRWRVKTWRTELSFRFYEYLCGPHPSRIFVSHAKIGNRKSVKWRRLRGSQPLPVAIVDSK